KALFCKYGNYENRSKARTRYMQDVLGDKLKDEFNAQLQEAMSEGGLDIEVSVQEITKQGIEKLFDDPRVIAQKQQGLYAVKFHPIGGQLTPDMLKDIYNAIKDMDDVSVRVAPDETMYIINCNGSEVQAVLEATECGA